MPSQMYEISVLLADDQPLVRAGIRKLLEHAEDIKVAGEAFDGRSARDLVRRLHPRILLLDLIMPGLSPAPMQQPPSPMCFMTITSIPTATS